MSIAEQSSSTFFPGLQNTLSGSFCQKIASLGWRRYYSGMSDYKYFERRDPFAPVLKLGTLLTRVRHPSANGVISLAAGEKSHVIRIEEGSISEVSGPDGPLDSQHATEVFAIPRPLVRFAEETDSQHRRRLLDPVHLMIHGIGSRTDLFEPISFRERVPASALSIDRDQLMQLRRLPFSNDEMQFFKALSHPTPVPMILWKRGLPPSHAAAMLTALNLLGVWTDTWKPGDFPRMHIAHRINRLADRDADDCEVLGLPQDASFADVDRAFRRLSFELHPDRTQTQPPELQSVIRDAFVTVSSAYQRLKSQRQSRRKRPVVTRSRDTVLWQQALTAAESALQQGNIHLARKHAINGLLLNPPEFARNRFANLLRYAA